MLTCWHNCHCRHANYICLVQISSSRLKQRLVYVYRLVLQWGSTNKACLDQTGNLWAFLKGNAYWHHTGVSIRINWHQISMFLYVNAFGLWKIPEFSISIGDSPMHCNVLWSNHHCNRRHQSNCHRFPYCRHHHHHCLTIGLRHCVYPWQPWTNSLHSANYDFPHASSSSTRHYQRHNHHHHNSQHCKHCHHRYVRKSKVWTVHITILNNPF